MNTNFWTVFSLSDKISRKVRRRGIILLRPTSPEDFSSSLSNMPLLFNHSWNPPGKLRNLTREATTVYPGLVKNSWGVWGEIVNATQRWVIPAIDHQLVTSSNEPKTICKMGLSWMSVWDCSLVEQQAHESQEFGCRHHCKPLRFCHFRIRTLHTTFGLILAKLI